MKQDHLIQWRVENPNVQDGVLTGSDALQEWMLPWWWERFRKFNPYKVAFADFGMSEQARNWCRQRGEVIPIQFPEGCLRSREDLPSEKIALWESIYNAERLWKSRKAWFMKSLAMVRTPFLRTIWIDLDCEVLGPLDEMFPACMKDPGIAAVVEPVQSIEKQVKFGLLKPGQKLYNTGVVVFKKGAQPILEWARESIEKNGDFPGNQTLLADLLWKEKWGIVELDPKYNWRMMNGPNPDAVIIHWVSTAGKNRIKQMLPNQSNGFKECR